MSAWKILLALYAAAGTALILAAPYMRDLPLMLALDIGLGLR